MASLGQAYLQALQVMQRQVLISAFFSLTLIARMGQALEQSPQPTQEFLLTCMLIAPGINLLASA